MKSPLFRCIACKREYKRPQERCACGSWQISRIEEKDQRSARNIGAIDLREAARIDTYDQELNRVLGGGIVLGSQVVIFGEPACGKSTLLTQIALEIAEGDSVLYVCGEETPAQVKSRCVRIGQNLSWAKIEKNLVLTSSITILALEKEIEDIQPVLVIVDSIASIQPERDVGGGARIIDAAEHLVRISKRTNTPLVIVQHITKDTTLAGPKAFEHLVDVVLQIEGDRRDQIRFLRAVKNRFGSTQEVGFYEMDETGLRPSSIGVDLSEREKEQTACLTLVSEGSRFFVHDIQAAIGSASGKLHVRGLRPDRVAMIAALIRNKISLPLPEELFVSCVGGGKIEDASADLPICTALLSAFYNLPISSEWIAWGELLPTGHFAQGRDDSRRLEFVSRRFPSAIHAITPKNTPNLATLVQKILEKRPTK